MASAAAVQFANDARKAAHAQTFLHRRQDFGVFPRFAEDDAVRMKADAGQRGREKIAAMQAPKHRPLQPRKYSGRESEAQAA